MHTSPLAKKKVMVAPTLAPILVVQHLVSGMEKKQRREEGLGRVMRAPEVDYVPLEGLDLSAQERGPILLHQTNHRVAISPLEERLEEGRLHLQKWGIVLSFLSEGEVQLDFSYHWNCGAPPRFWAQHTTQFGLGQWVQVRYNGRFSPYRSLYVSDWSYAKNVFNVGLTRDPTPDMFLRNEPSDRYSMISDLF